MAEFLNGQIDYIFFCYGLAFIILAAVCTALRKAEREHFPWIFLGLFGLIHGISEWLDLLALIAGDTAPFEAFRILVKTASFLFLAEFGRAGGILLSGRGPSRGILLLPAAFIAAGGWIAGLAGLNAASRYGLALTGGLWAAAALYRYAKTRETGRPLILASLFLGLYAIATGLIVPSLPVFPADIVSEKVFYQWTGVPIQLIRSLLAAAIFIAIFVYSQASLNASADHRYLAGKFRSLHWTFTLMLTLILTAGWAMTIYLGDQARRDVVRNGIRNTVTIANQVSDVLKESEGAVTAIAGSPWVAPAFLTGRPRDIDRANRVLDRYQGALDISVCYLLNLNGKAIASSNRRDADSFVGHSYAFRSYFRQAVLGTRSIQLALGATSGERGCYASRYVLGPGRKIVGVAVVKKNLDRAERELSFYSNAFFVSPEGIIFLSGRPEQRLKGLWPLTENALAKVVADKQFGPGPFPALLAGEPQNGVETLLNGRPYLVTRQFLNPAGWSIILFSPLDMIALYRFMGILVTFTLCLLTIGFSVGFQKSLESAAEVALYENRFRTIFENAPGAIFIADGETHRILSFNPFMIRWLGYNQEELLSAPFDDLRASGDEEGHCRYRKKDGSLVDVEEVRSGVPFHGKEAILIIAHDISDLKRAEAILQKLSMQDGLTGIANRRHFDEFLAREWKRAQREKTPLSLIMADIDYFKAYNDTYGHQKGDDCLRAVAGSLQQSLRRPSDMATRYGGEEFAIVLPATSAKGALIVAETLRTGVELLAIPHAASPAGPVVTISLGAATTVPAPDASPADLLSAADQALYRAKSSGRNRVSS